MVNSWRPSRRWLGLVVTGTLLCGAGAGALTRVTSASATSAAAQPACSAGTEVRTADGPVCGIAAGGVTSYLGIPYAAPPVGRLRFAPPQRATPWTTTFAATAAGPQCPEPGGPTNEDCLYLNVRVPAAPSPGPLAVMVEIHGGGFSFLSAPDGSYLASAGNVIVVEVSYRLGILGFLAEKALGAHSGDYALQDEQAALQWVQRNIAAFGGDPGNVTIFGQSAGGSSVCDNSVSPTAEGLFQKGISESGYYNSLLGADTSWQPQDCKVNLPTEAEAQRAGASFAAAVGCGDASDVAACLRAVPVQTLLDKAGDGLSAGEGTLAPIVNGTTLPMSPARAFATGHVNPVKLMVGVSRDEVQLDVATTPDQYRTLIRQQYGALAPAVTALYPLARFPNSSPFIAYRTIVADSDAVCPMLVNDRRLARDIPLYAWEIDNADAPTSVVVDPAQPNGSFHVSENGFLFPFSRYAAPAPYDADQAAFQSQLVAEWTGFARTGTPSVTGSPLWTRFTPRSPLVMSLVPAGDSALTPAATMEMQHHCDFWDAVAPAPRH